MFLLIIIVDNFFFFPDHEDLETVRKKVRKCDFSSFEAFLTSYFSTCIISEGEYFCAVFLFVIEWLFSETKWDRAKRLVSTNVLLLFYKGLKVSSPNVSFYT